MTPRLAPRGLARVGFATLAVVLAIFALPPARGSALLLPALLAVGVGFALVALTRQGPPVARTAAGLFALYAVLIVTLFVLSSPFTLGKHGSVASGDPPAWAYPAFEALLVALPVVLVAGAAVTAWPWSGTAGRIALVTGVALLGGFFAFDWLSTPTGFDTVGGAEVFGRAANWSMSLAAAAVLAAVALLVRGDPAPPAASRASANTEP